MNKANIDQYVYVQCRNRDHTRCSANGVGCVRVESVEKSVALAALDAKDELIADLLSFAVSGPEAQGVKAAAWRTEDLAALKARAEK